MEVAILIALAVTGACGGTETVVQTVVVKEEVAVEVETGNRQRAEVEKEVVVQGETVVQLAGQRSS